MGGISTHILFDLGATHSFVAPKVASSFDGEFTKVNLSIPVLTPGDQVLETEGCILRVPIIIQDMIFPADLLVLPLERYEVILGMDWLSSYRAQLDCGRGNIVFERDTQPPLAYHGIVPSVGASLVSALRIENLLEKGEEVYLVTLVAGPVEDEKEQNMEEIPVVREYEDVFKALEGFSPSRSNAFSITLEPGSAAIAKAPYRIVARVGEVAYRLELPPDMLMHPAIHVSMLRKHISDPNMVELQRPENLQPNLTYPEGPLRIGEHRFNK